MGILNLEDNSEVLRVVENFLGVKDLDDRTRIERRSFDNLFEEICRQAELDEEEGLEKQIAERGFNLEKVFANVPLYGEAGVLALGVEYAKRKIAKEIREYVVLPAWWLPNVMDRIKQKDMLPFAVYVK
jgi:hypothetical protein